MEKDILQYNHLSAEAKAALCRKADIIGMTTTGAAKNQQFLKVLGPKIGNSNHH